MTQVAADSLGLPPKKSASSWAIPKLPTAPELGRLGGGGHGIVVGVYGLRRTCGERLIKVAMKPTRKSPLYQLPSPKKWRLKKAASSDQEERGEKARAFTDLMKRARDDRYRGHGCRASTARAIENRPAPPCHRRQAAHKDKKQRAEHSMHSFGAHFCEVRVDADWAPCA